MTSWGGFFVGIWLIVRKSLRQHLLSTIVTVFSLALGSGLVMAVFSVNRQAYDTMTGGTAGFDAVLGARGSELQLVLNTVFHLETSPGNIPWAMYQEMKDDPRVQLAIPYAVGDNFHNFRIVGTTEEIFTEFEYVEGRKFEVESPGRFFDPLRQEVVVGSVVAQRLGLKIGDVIQPYHGLDFDERQKHKAEYAVVGILRPTNSPSDRVLWIPIEGIFRMDGHVLRGTGTNYHPDPNEVIPDEHKEVSAVMLKFSGGPRTGMFFDQMINLQGKAATLAYPVAESMIQFFEKMGWVNRILEMVAYLVVVVGAGSVLASIYNTMNERRREFAILRSLGARRTTVFAAIVTESSTIALLGALFGLFVYFAILIATAWLLQRNVGVVLDPWSYHPALWLTPLGMLLIGAFSGVVPAIKAYSTDLARNLVPTS